MVIMSGTATVLQQFVSGLKSRNEDTRAKSAKDLQHYVTTELREVRAKTSVVTVDISQEDVSKLHCDQLPTQSMHGHMNYIYTYDT